MARAISRHSGTRKFGADHSIAACPKSSLSIWTLRAKAEGGYEVAPLSGLLIFDWRLQYICSPIGFSDRPGTIYDNNLHLF